MNSNETTLYIDGTSLLHALHPFGKLAFVMLTGAVVYCLPGTWLPDAVLLGICAILASAGGVFQATWKFSWRTMVPLSLFMLPIHGLLNPGNHTPLFTWQSITLYREGILFAGTTILQIQCVLAASLLFVFTTHPADLLAALKKAGWSSSIAYLLSCPLLLLPTLRSRIETIQSAQKARGLNVQGNPLNRIRSLVPLVAPLILGAFDEIEQRAIALEVRGFHHKGIKTSLKSVPDSQTQRSMRWLIMGTTLLIILHKMAS